MLLFSAYGFFNEAGSFHGNCQFHLWELLVPFIETAGSPHRN